MRVDGGETTREQVSVLFVHSLSFIENRKLLPKDTGGKLLFSVLD